MAGAMADVLNLVMLICASVGSLAFGVLAAYGILRVAFSLMRRQPRAVVAKARQEVVRAL
jgi:ABC-type glycerol-3-phosphate transport system permease component